MIICPPSLTVGCPHSGVFPYGACRSLLTAHRSLLTAYRLLLLFSSDGSDACSQNCCTGVNSCWQLLSDERLIRSHCETRQRALLMKSVCFGTPSQKPGVGRLASRHARMKSVDESTLVNPGSLL